MKYSKSQRLCQATNDKENCSRNANRRSTLNQMHMTTLQETEKKLHERHNKAQQRSTTMKKYGVQHPTLNEQIYATHSEKTERMLNLIFIALDQKKLGYLSKHNISCYRLASTIFRPLKPLLIHIVENSNGNYVVDYREFKRLVLKYKLDQPIYQQLFMEHD